MRASDRASGGELAGSPPGRLHLTEADHRDLLARVRTPIIAIEGGVIRHANSGFGDLLGLQPEDLLGVPLANLLHEGDHERVASWLGRAREEDLAEAQAEVRLVAPDGTHRWANVRFVGGTWNGDDAVICFLADMEGIRRGREVEEQLRQSQKMEAVGRLAGGIAHDMNNVLGAIMGFASVIQAEMDPASRMRDDVDHILGACRKGRDLMLNLLGFARKGKYRLELFALDDLVRDVVELLKHTIPKKIQIDVRRKQDGLRVHGDRTQIHHALMNVCLNSVDAMGESGTLGIFAETVTIIEPELAPCPELEPGVYSAIRVSDTGHGMDRHVMSMAFEPFFTTKPIGQGSGLGLPMVYGTVKNHGGAVILESTPGQGTAVTMLLPSATSPSQVLRALSERRSPSDPAGVTILLVDDEAMIRNAGRRLLEKLGYRVLLAADGRDALRVFCERKACIGAVMLDLVMPLMDGEETLARLKEIEPEIPVLLCSGFSKEEKAEELLERGAVGFIQKPFDLRTLGLRLAEILRD